MNPIAKLFVISGLMVLVLGLLIELFQRLHLPIGKLPGDFYWEGENSRFYFPLTTCALLSFFVSIGAYFWNSLK